MVCVVVCVGLFVSVLCIVRVCLLLFGVSFCLCCSLVVVCAFGVVFVVLLVFILVCVV